MKELQSIISNEQIYFAIAITLGVFLWKLFVVYGRFYIPKLFFMKDEITKIFQKVIDFFDKMIGALIYVPTFLYGLVTYFQITDKLPQNIQNYFLEWTFILTAYTFFDQLFNAFKVFDD